ncbi:SAVMC3_10250 family protein [Streptomyces sp. NRRL B-24720]|uniref:SAVMC3_10250 family protein n=1 Tax=Streptomyces sp. NRRL B-24720 TaxID=1476876 RepID=UPI0004CB3E3F
MRCIARRRGVLILGVFELNEFLPEPRRALPTVKLHAGVSLAGINVETPAPDNAGDLRRHLERVEKEMDLHTAWYTEPDLSPGRWVQFEAPLNWITLRGRHQDLVLFVDPPPDAASPHQAGASRRLLLHGSARHLLGRPPLQVDGPELTGLEGNGHSAGRIFVTNAGHVVNALAHAHDPLEAGSGVSEGNTPVSPTSVRRSGIRDLLQAVDAESSEVSTHALMFGYARVSALLPETATETGCLVASPLIVEYAN